ncbi:uncharacterized protein LOC135080653 [Ostrinia nubilalis]|uniref:uncharacterized protein LOC135080653 n=1 Tax=Ostrinia nubilalis TaxID=29057 RepID=UPI0030824940
MTVLLYDYCELEERAARHLRTWKTWHIILYVLAAIFGAANYILLHKTMELVNDHCVLYPRKLEFHVVPRSNYTDEVETNVNYTMVDEVQNGLEDDVTSTDGKSMEKSVTKREIPDNETMDSLETTMDAMNVTVVTGNVTHQLVLDLTRSLFAFDSDCQFAEYMPVMSTICALVWVTLFTMCPGGGHARSGLQQPWRILTPALLFALVMVGLTGHSFTRTNGGLHAFCGAFANLTNSTTCSSVDPFLELSWSTSWGFGGRAAATRAASAGAWAAWACAAALMLARCLAAPDFVVRRTGAYLKDPQGKLTPHLKKGRRSRQSQRSAPSSPGVRDNVSVYSEPTATTELATASVGPGQDSAPTSLMVTPVRKGRAHDNHDLIEMTYAPQERRDILQ